MSETRWWPYRCRGRLAVKVGYEQVTRPSPMPFGSGALGNAKVGRASVPISD